MAKLNNVEIHFKHSNRTYNTMTAFLVLSSTPMKRTVSKAKRKAKPSQKSPLHVEEEVTGLEAPTTEDRQRKDRTARRDAVKGNDARNATDVAVTRYEGVPSSQPEHNNDSLQSAADHDEVLSEHKWQVTSVLKMNGCGSQNCATKVHMINEYDILNAHSQFSSKSIQEQSLWIVQYLATHCPSNTNGEKDIKKIPFYIHGRAVCLSIWLQTLHCKKRSSELHRK